MDITATLPNTPDYRASYRPKNKWQLLLACVWTFTCTLNLIKAYKQHLHGDAFDSFNIIWVVCLFFYVLIIIDILLTRVTFTIQNGQLTVVKRGLFRQKTTDYEIDQMHNLEIEQIIQKKYLAVHFEAPGKYGINFYYYEEYKTIGGLPTEDNAQQLIEAIAAASV